jgi:N-acetylneuraminic acid mutarotase
MFAKLSKRRLAGAVAALAGLIAMGVPGNAAAAASGRAIPAVRPAGHGSPAARPAAGSAAASRHPAGAAAPVTFRRACPPPSPGHAACLALVRTDRAGHPGRLAAGQVPPGYGPADLQAAYALPSATDGSGATVAIVDAYDDPTAAADLAVYRQHYGLPPCTTANGCFRKVNQRGGTSYPPRDGGWAEEISLDLDMVSAVCPKCHILLVEADSDLVTDLGAAVNEAVALGAQYVSNSYGTDGEFAGELAWDAAYYNHPGVVVTGAAGDGGYGTSFPAASPHVVAVGGTTLTRDASTPRGWTETAWSGTGSGCSSYEPKPAWQHDRGCPDRTEVDVSAVADPVTGVAVYDSYQGQGWAVFGGTSVATPVITSVYALAGRPVGGTYPGSYPYADPSALNNVTSGSNSSGGCSPQYLCTAGRGYNGPTGLGTPNGVAAFAAPAHGDITGTVRDAATGAPLAGARVSLGTGFTVTGRSGQYAATAVPGRYTAVASKAGYASQAVRGVTITAGATTREDFTVRPFPTGTVTGTVRDASGHGWPLLARVSVAGTSTVAYTSPVTGRYRLTLPVTGASYTLDVSAVYPGYRAARVPVTLTSAGARADVGLRVDELACTAPGYQPAYHGYTQDFNGPGQPPGWTVQNQPRRAPGWQFDSHLPNYTGGSGGFALANGLTGPAQTTGLFTPKLDLSGDAAPVLQFDQDLSESEDYSIVYIEVSLDGGKSWIDVDDYFGPSFMPGPDTRIYPLPEAARHRDVEVVFWATGFQGSASWELDNVFVGERDCVADRGGLVVGQVRDQNTGGAVEGASVTSSIRPGSPAGTGPVPGDPAAGGGWYWLASGPGQPAITASAGGYRPQTARPRVEANAVTRADFRLAAGRLAVAPGALSVTGAMDGPARTARLAVTNTGSAPVSVDVTGLAGEFTMAGPRQPAAPGQAAGAPAPLRLVPGHFSPRPLAGAAGRGGPSGPGRARAGTAAVPPYTPPWAPIAHYPEQIVDNAAATDPASGVVYSVGGVNDNGNSVADVFAFDPARGTWSQLPSMHYTRDAPTAAVIAGKLYVTGGFDGANNVNQPALEIYDPATGLWSQGAPIPHAYYGATVAVLDGKMYVIGGCGTSGVCTSTNVQVYDPATDAWTAAAAYPRKISFLGCGAISGKLYCAGGFDHDLGYGTTAAYVYSPKANTWRSVAPLPAGLWGGGYAAANGLLLLSGGITRFDEALTNQGFAYDPVTNRWSSLPNSPQELYRGGSACGLYRIGGEDASGNLYASAEQLPGYTECDGGVSVPWLSASPGRLVLAPGQRATVTVTLRAGPAQGISQPGRYTATLRLDSGVPYPAVAVPVTFTVRPPAGWGKLAGTVEGRSCAGHTAPLPGATVQVDSKAGDWILTAGRGGQYGMWLDQRDSPLTLITTASGWQAASTTARVRAGRTTAVPFTLEQVGCG